VAPIIVGGLLQGSVFAIVALGFALVYRVTGVINLSQGAFCIVGALSMYTLQQTLGWPGPLAALAAVAGTGVFGAALGAATFVPALSRLPNSSMLMLTAGLLTLVEGVVLVVWGSDPYDLASFSGEAPVDVLGVRVPSQGLWIAGTALIVIVALWFLLSRTILGKELRACAENPLAARLMGIDVPRMTLLSFALAAMIGAIGGIVVAPIASLQFDSGQFFTIYGFIAVAIGGMGSFIGAVVGGLILGVAQQLFAGYISSLFSNALAVVLLLATLLLRPSGLFMTVARRHDVRDEQQIHLPIVRFRARDSFIFGAVAVAALMALPWLVPQSSGLLGTLVIAGILFIGVLGLDVLMGYAGQVSLGQGGFMAIGGYTAAILAVRYGWPPLAGTAAGILLSLVCALVLSLATMRLRGVYLALATFELRPDDRFARRRHDGHDRRPVRPRWHSIVFHWPVFVRQSAGDVLFGGGVDGRARAAALRWAAIGLRPRAQSHSHRSDRRRSARHQCAALQGGGVCDQRRAGVAVRQPLRVLLSLSLARNGQHIALAGDDHHAGDRRRGDAGGLFVWRRTADAVAGNFPAVRPLQAACRRRAARPCLPVSACGHLWLAGRLGIAA
jgi:branched-subunit amino acid ABC-type transport system permease component